jgi:amidophosphoribosyltransferase
MKFNPLPGNLAGRRVVLVDDSIVRGTTSGPLVELLRKAGALEVHVRVACPPIRHPCFMGVDMASHDELIAATHSVEEIRRHIGADSLAYLSIEGLMTALTSDDREADGGDAPRLPFGENIGGHAGDAVRGYCNACFTGRYPFESVPVELGRKDLFDGVLADADHEAAAAAPVGLRP